MNSFGPQLPISKWVYDTKYLHNESFEDGMARVAGAVSDDDEHFRKVLGILKRQEFLPGGRIVSAMGATRVVTANNCYVMDTLPDSMAGIIRVLGEAAQTMRMGGGVGYDFSTLRPRGSAIKTLDSQSSGPLAFMDVFDAMCGCISSAGHRRGAQMGVLRVDHPDIEEFIEAKCNTHRLTNFNISVAITDEFMEAVKADAMFQLRWGGSDNYPMVRATALWDKIMRATWDWAEPGVLFIDRINRKNNLWYCESIAATNPCGEQPLPPHGACLLGSFNLTQFISDNDKYGKVFNIEKFKNTIPDVVRAMDNVVDAAVYPLTEQYESARDKRRMGLGITGLANTAEVLGAPYGSTDMLEFTALVMSTLRDTAYRASISLAMEKGAFPLFDEKYLESEFAKTLPDDIRADIRAYGIRNSHLLSIAPTGTISLGANNVSSGIEPVFSYEYSRDVRTFDGTTTEKVTDWAYREHGVKGKTTDDVTVQEHVDVLNLASYYVDSACSKTCNVGGNVNFKDFKQVYIDAYEGGASGCTTFRIDGKRFGMMRTEEHEPQEEVNETEVIDGAACYIDPDTGIRSCE